MNQNTGIQLKGVMENDVRLFADQLRKATGYKLPILKNGDNTLVFQINKALNLPDQDGYTIEVSDKNIIINAQSGNGIFYATQTLRQLLPAAVEEEQAKPQEWIIPGVTIKDYPRYSWRGYMKDVSRTFYGVDVIKKYLDLMALYKMNTFHWHLTDDQGWRIEIKKYPK
ncbi:family 20 glycosylhydrolase, partial [Sphingobacterium mizutaii]|uniref:family 20 glycosylhydrolase n=1 Tax=Sphingobacterium mizutaii TaxID=1010 RepID=UPI00293C121E